MCEQFRKDSALSKNSPNVISSDIKHGYILQTLMMNTVLVQLAQRFHNQIKLQSKAFFKI